jgi:hypothetical protein
LFEVLASVEAENSTTTVKEEEKVVHPIRHVANIAEYCIPLEADKI